MKHSLLIFLLVITGGQLFSQDMPNVVPPSPEASALAQFTDVPVSYYTGMPNISVPFYTIQQQGVTVPISLNYHARGVRVSEVASQTGLGWSLSYGGSVSRQIRGKSDEASGNGYFANQSNFINYPINETTRDVVDGQETTDPAYDFYPDQFSFNAGGISGKFVFDYNTLEPVVQSYDDVKISYTRENGATGKIDSFTITDSKGNIYYFGISKDTLRTAQDYQTSSGKSISNNINVELDLPASTDDQAYSAWKLMDIESPNGELINYFYDYNVPSATSYWSKSYDKHNPTSGSSNTLGNMNNINEINTRLSLVSNYENQISKIEFNKGRDSILFTKSQTLREDFDGYALERVSVYADNQLLKSYKLNYIYTTSSDETNLLWYFTSQNATTQLQKYFKRMFLDSVEEEGNNGQKLPPYEFTYNEDYILPSIFSSKQDYWGYFNDATDNGPFTRIVDYGNHNVDRRVDTLKSEAGILKEIKYPTGGSSKFTYEHNKGRSPDFVNKLFLPDINPGANATIIELTKADFQYTSGGYTPYNIPVPNSTNITYEFQCFHLSYVNSPPDLPDCLFYFTINGSGGPEAGYINETLTLNSGNKSSISIGVHAPNFPNVDYDLHLDPNYDFRIIVTYNDNDYDNLYAAGKRIKKIEHIDENNVITTKEFEYKYPALLDASGNVIGQGGPSGGIIGFPAYLNKANANDPAFITHTKYYDATSAYGSFQPNSIGYSSVIEYHGTKANNIGKTEYLFTNISDSGGDYYEFPYHPPTDNEWLRGKPISTKIYKADANATTGFTIVKEVYNKYLYGNVEYTSDFEYTGGFVNPNFEFTPVGIEYEWDINAPSDYLISRTLFKLPLFMKRRHYVGDDINSDADWGYRVYHLTGGTVNLLRTIQKEYNTSGVLETETTYDYDYPNHYQLKESVVTNSQDKNLTTTYYYPTDRNNITGGLSTDALNAAEALNNENRFEVIQTESTTKDQLDNLLSKNTVRTNYEDFGSNLILPKTVETLKGVHGGLETRLEYTKYDSYGNILEVKKASGTTVSYIWGYSHQYPVAKIENATYTELESVLGSGFDLGVFGLSESQASSLRSGLPNAMVSTYVYKPLVGVTSITDPRGNTMTYHYDAFNRLEHVKDQDGNILSKNEYNYANQN